MDPIIKKVIKHEVEETTDSKVTLSGVLNCIDGLWSSCGGERIIVFSTNYLDKLDPALIRKGRMDKHIEKTYCCVEAFKVLANNYLEIDSLPLFEQIGGLWGQTKSTPADVSENLMKSDDETVDLCLNRLIEALKAAKEEEGKKIEEGACRQKKRERDATIKQRSGRKEPSSKGCRTR